MLEEILKSDKPSELIREHKEEIFNLIPELRVCDGFMQHNDYHIYDVFEHILHVVDNVDNIYLLRVAALFHDVGKPMTFTVDANGVGHMLGHWEESSRIFLRHLDLFNFNEQEVELVNNLILYHDLRFNVDNMPFFEYKFGDNMYLLISHKKADIIAQNPKYIKRLEEMDEIIRNSNIISLEHFEKVDMRVGTIIDASINKKTKHPAYKLKIDLGAMGIKNSSAQITDLYEPSDLINRQVIVVTNFKPIHVSEITSEVRILGAMTDTGVVLISPDNKVLNGSLID